MIILFKLILFAFLLATGYVVFFRLCAVLAHRMIIGLLGLVLCIFIFFPAFTSRMAEFFGIGRGVDFVFYLAHVFWAYIVARLYVGQQRLQYQLTELTRAI